MSLIVKLFSVVALLVEKTPLSRRHLFGDLGVQKIKMCGYKGVPFARERDRLLRAEEKRTLGDLEGVDLYYGFIKNNFSIIFCCHCSM